MMRQQKIAALRLRGWAFQGRSVFGKRDLRLVGFLGQAAEHVTARQVVRMDGESCLSVGPRLLRLAGQVGGQRGQSTCLRVASVVAQDRIGLLDGFGEALLGK